MQASTSIPSAPAKPYPWYRSLYGAVLLAAVLGIAVGAIWPDIGASLKPLGDGFIKLVKMVIAPVIFCTVITGIAGMESLERVGRVGIKALGYFLFFSTLALIVGLVMGNLVQPGAGMNIDPATLDPASVSQYQDKAREAGIVAFLLDIIPDTMVGALTSGSILQVLLISLLIGIALTTMGEAGRPIIGAIRQASDLMFRLVRLIMYAAPVGVFGSMAFTIGKYGLESLGNLIGLIATFYLTSAIFVIVVLGLVSRACGFSIFRLIAYIRQELLLVLGTSSSEAALPNLMAKLECAGADRSVVGLVVPTGYSFNLDGTNIYMTMAALFIAQATNTDLSIADQVLLLLVAMISSKGSAGVTGAGFITLAATLSVVPAIPVVAMALILGIDRFMSECRALTNFIGNAVATLVVAKWEGALDKAALDQALTGTD
jgi:aerobic C4-dicarboxylate transport protein